MTTLPQRPSSLGFWVGCASVFLLLLLIAVGGTMFWMLRRQQRTAHEGFNLPAEWRSTLRALARAPSDIWVLAPPRSEEGNAAEVLRRFPVGDFKIALLKFQRERLLDGRDSAVIAAILRDTSLDAVARAARMTTYSVVEMDLHDDGRGTELFGVRFPTLEPRPNESSALTGLLLRGYARSRAGRAAEAEADLKAAVGLSAMGFEREPTWMGSRRSLTDLGDAAQELARVLAGRRDTAGAGAATRLHDWTRRNSRATFDAWLGLFTRPDSALSVIGDTTMPFPVRAEAVYYGTLGRLRMGPWSAFRGPGNQMMAIVREAERSADPDLRALALAADSNLSRMNRVGGWRRVRLGMRAQSRER